MKVKPLIPADQFIEFTPQRIDKIRTSRICHLGDFVEGKFNKPKRKTTTSSRSRSRKPKLSQKTLADLESLDEKTKQFLIQSLNLNL